MRKLSAEKRVAILSALIEGNSVSATARMCRVSKLTVLRLLCDVGVLCQDFHDLTVRRLTCERIQVDEIWSFVGCKQKTKMLGGVGDGDCWTWIAIDADSKLVVAYLAGLRDGGYATAFLQDVAARLVNRVQLTTDSLRAYREAVPDAFGENIDYAMLEKYYGMPEGKRADQKYTPSTCLGTRKCPRIGNPDPDHISTSYIERQNLTLRMRNRRFTRLTNGFSKKWVNHEHAIALHYFVYNFVRIHMTLGKTPAMAAGIADHAWTVDELVALLEREEGLRGNGGRINREDRK